MSTAVGTAPPSTRQSPSSSTSSGSDVDTSDGRRARRTRNRDAVIDALLALYDAGDLAPSADAIAERAGLSARSLFRYFDDGDDLARAAISRQQERLAPIFAVPVEVADTRARRVHAAVARRVQLLDAMGNVGKVARLRAPFQPAVAAELRRVRAAMRDLTAAALAPDLDALTAARAEGVLAAIDVACSYEAYELLREDLGRTRRRAASAMADSVLALLTVASPEPETARAAR